MPKTIYKATTSLPKDPDAYILGYTSDKNKFLKEYQKVGYKKNEVKFTKIDIHN